MCVADIADRDSVNCTKRFLLFSYLDLRVCFACYPPEYFKIISVEIRQHKLSFFAKLATKCSTRRPQILSV